jgi:hypothetical protein
MGTQIHNSTKTERKLVIIPGRRGLRANGLPWRRQDDEFGLAHALGARGIGEKFGDVESQLRNAAAGQFRGL